MRPNRLSKWLGVVALVLFGARAFAVQLPPKPADQKFVQDYAGVFSSQSMVEMGRIQEQAFTNYDVPIIVVSVRSMSDYGYTGGDIAEFAKSWFDHWGIGKQGPDGTVINRGMLVLLSIQDRKVRIELGAEWGRAWDGYCEAVVQDRMVPRFKQGQYAQGVLDGMAALLELSSKNPLADLPVEADAPLLSQLPLSDLKVSTSPFTGRHLIQATLIGAVLIVLSFFFPAARKALLIGGVAIIAIVWLFWLCLILLAVFSKSKSGRSGGYSGGGFSGGFSGGGGASGSW